MHKPPHTIIRRAALLAAAAAALAAPAAASAAPDFTPASTVDGTIDARVGFAHGEETRAHWELLSQNPPDTRVVVSTRNAGGSFADQLTIPSGGGFLPTTSRLVVAPNGAAALTWEELQDGDPNHPVRYRADYRRPDGTWEPPVTIVSDPGFTGEDPVVAIGPNGTAVVVVSHEELNSPGETVPDFRVDASVHGPSGGWDGPTRLSTPDRSTGGVRAGVDAAGNVTVTYSERYNEKPDRRTAMLRRRSASNGIWATAEDLTQSAPLHDGEAPALSVAPDGRAVVALQSTQDGPDHVYAAVRESGSGSFGKLVPIGPEDALTSAPAATGIAPNGTAYVLYDVQATQPGGDHAGLVRAAPNAGFTPPQRVSPLGVSDTRGQLAFSGNDAVAAWEGTSSGNEVVQGVHWSAGSPSADDFRDLDAPSDSASIEDVESDGDGGVEVLWSHKSLTSRVAAYDAGAPVAGDASIPADAVAGQPVPMKAAFTDRWSTLDAAGPQWDFGDGASGSGTDVSHAYAQPGDYTVHVRSADVLGNARERTFPVHVTAVPSGPLPAGAAKPKVKLSAPTCAPKVRGQACRRFLVRRSTWKVLHGTASDAARVQVTVKRSGSTKARVLRAKLAGGRWVARTGGLKAGRTTFTVRAFGADGSASKPVTKKVRLR